MKKIWLEIPLIFVIMIGCGKYSKEELLAAPEQIEIHGQVYYLSTYLHGKPLEGSVYIVTVDSSTIPPGSLDADHAWVINGDDIWDTDLYDPTWPINIPFMVLRAFEDKGPDWETGTYVDVVVELVDGEMYVTDSSYLIRADSQLIRTE